MGTPIVDIVEGAGGSHHIMNGWAITRIATISNLNTDLADDNTGKLLQEAEDILVATIGDRGSSCPGINVPTYLEQFIPEVVSTEHVKFRVIYKGYPRPIYEVSSCLAQVESNLDKNNNPIILSYNYPSDYVQDPRKAGQTLTQGGMVSRPKPEVAFTVRWVQVGDSSNIATYWATYWGGMVGKMNDATYTIGAIVGVAKTWLITNVRGVSKDGGITYEMSMTFQYRSETWDQLVVYINPDDGKPPTDLVAGTGYKRVVVCESVSFPTFSFGPN